MGAESQGSNIALHLIIANDIVALTKGATISVFFIKTRYCSLGL
jgi:hypothetical protein